MSSVFIIGLTGPTGSGKTLLSKRFEEEGFVLLNADDYAREATGKDLKTIAGLVQAFGTEILCKDGTLDRKALAKAAFQSAEGRRKLNEITHPVIVRLIDQKIRELCEKGHRKILIDAPLLFEAKADKICNLTIGVLADRQERFKRILSRENISPEDALIRINAGQKDGFYIEKCDYIVYNNGNIKDTLVQIESILEHIKGEELEKIY